MKARVKISTYKYIHKRKKLISVTGNTAENQSFLPF
uniref:Uncharacterized protein n=1 Tax=Manihot esculenta TaxID=3983 RepID=A0A2C9WN91_MANES